VTEQEAKEILGLIEQDLNSQQAPAVSVQQIEIHHAGLWARLQQSAGANYRHTASGVTLYGIPAALGAKRDIPYTLHFTA